MHFRQWKRREFITLLGGAAAAWPLAARGQQAAMPVIGYLGAGFPAPSASVVAILRRGLAEAGYVEGRNVAIEYRFAEGKYDRLPALAAELVRRQVAVIVAVPTPAALAAKAATTTIPIVFTAGEDPVKVGLVANLARPGGNVTGGSILFADLGPKQLGLLRELVPTAVRIGLLVNPTNMNAADVTKDLTAAGAAMGVQIEIVQASSILEIDAAFASLVRKRVDALVAGTDSFFFNRRLQLATLATRHAIPAVYNAREYAEAGGLMSYGTSLMEAFRQVAIYTGRILQGAKPADLPVVQSSKFEFVINLSTARALGIDVPPTLLARADEVIE
jgi:putative tryptophan/tyrosine transport system substrate-binding protein